MPVKLHLRGRTVMAIATTKQGTDTLAPQPDGGKESTHQMRGSMVSALNGSVGIPSTNSRTYI